MEHKTPRILIIRLSAIGDVVRTIPVLHGLREAFPHARIDWAVERRSASILKGHPALDQLLVFDREESSPSTIGLFLTLCVRILKNRYDTVLDLHGIAKSGLLTLSSLARHRIGFAPPRARELSYLFTNKWVRLPSETMNRVEENMLLCRAIAPDISEPSIQIAVPLDIQEHVDTFYDSEFDAAKYVVVIHAPVDRQEKQWPLDYYAELSDLLLADGRFETLFTWGPGQFQTIEYIIERTRRMPGVAPKTPDLKHLAWMLHSAHLYVGGDTGPMHIAAAMGTPVVAIFGGTDPAKHAPWGVPHRIVQTTDTQNISQEKRMRSISPENVYDACVDLLFNSSGATETTSSDSIKTKGNTKQPQD